MLDANYWNIVARAIDLEDDKIDLFIPYHNPSRGTAREAILRNLLVTHTPDPYVVSTGFVYEPNQDAEIPAQCDVLVYDPRISQPYYRLDEFVVVSPRSARVIVEVKSRLQEAEFDKTVAIRRKAPCPVLGFAFEGWAFETFCQSIAQRIAELTELPECLVVHRQNYMGIRASDWRRRPRMMLIFVLTYRTSRIPMVVRPPNDFVLSCGFWTKEKSMMGNCTNGSTTCKSR